MKLRFKRVKLVNFNSYAESEVYLNDKGFCAVTGKNNYIKDGALSNGCGKSTIWTAICYALTGETINGLTNNLKNILVDDNECYVELDFFANKDEYKLIRHHKPKSDLKIFKNGENISGKGIRESEKILYDNLPDLNKNLISSTIIIGQGMPNKFSSFNPSGRKDLLEKLTKSDFMIEDIKNRINERLAVLNGQKRTIEDTSLITKTKISTLQTNINNLEQKIKSAVKPDFEKSIADCDNKINLYAEQIKSFEDNLKEIDENISKLNNQLIELNSQKSACTNKLLESYHNKIDPIKTEKNNLDYKMSFLQKELTKLKSIKDTCPTCGQKLSGVTKPDTAAQEQELEEIKKRIFMINEELITADKNKATYEKQISDQFIEQINQLNLNINTSKSSSQELKIKLSSLSQNLQLETREKDRLAYSRDSWDNVFKNNVQELENNIAEKNKLSDELAMSEKSLLALSERLAVVKKIDTLVKRDFRGFLLYNIVDYINKKAKEYSKIVFGTDELNIYLDGNALDITYCNKIIDSLSGGERQRVDIITQFAIRDMLQTYFNYSSNILVLDEITDNLDRVATSKLFSLISDKLKDVESVFIISHHNESLDISIDSEINIIKNDLGISLITKQ